jgi:DNA polymerase III epsilon subunit-like protein
MIFVDNESVNLDPRSLVSLGAVEYERHSNTFYEECRVPEGMQISEGALKINGFTVEQVTDPNKQGLGTLMLHFCDWTKSVEEVTLAGENVGYFDMRGITDSLGKFGIENVFGHRSVDLHTVMRKFHEVNGFQIPIKGKHDDISLDYALEFVGMPKEPMPHNGLTGAKLEAEVYSRLQRGSGLFEEYAKHQVSEKVAKAKIRV